MKKKSFKIGEKNLMVARLDVQQVMDLTEQLDSFDRDQLIADLDESKVTGEERLKALREQSGQKGLVSNLIRSAFTMKGAMRIISSIDGMESWPLSEASPDEISEIALHSLGFDMSEFEESAEKKETSNEDGKK